MKTNNKRNVTIESMVDFLKLLSEPQRKKVEARIKYHKENVDKASAMSDKELADNVEYFLKNCSLVESAGYREGTPVYDATMHFIFIPEMIKRLRRKKED